LWIALRSRQASNIDEQSDLIRLKQRNEFVNRSSRMTNRPDFHGLKTRNYITSKQL